MGGETVKIAGLRQGYPYLRLDAYQRASSWSDALRAAFIVSVANDWPTGIIVLNRIEDDKSASRALAASHDIIDGQQRLTTIFDFLENPLLYVHRWARQAVEEEPPALTEFRDDFIQVAKELRKKGSGFVAAGQDLEAVKERVLVESLHEFKKKVQDENAEVNPQLQRIVERMIELLRIVSQRSFVIQELRTSTTDAEKMYRAINTHGKPVEWWELLRASEFNKSLYQGDASYAPRYSALIARLAQLYFEKNKIAPKDRPSSPTLWDALFAVGEYFHFYLAGKNPGTASPLVSKDQRKLKVDGLGFRLVTAFLTHEISRVRIDRLTSDYAKVTLAHAMDCLIDTGLVLFENPGKFKLFKKYSSFGADVIPSYPLMGLIIAATHLVAENGASLNLTDPQRQSLRTLAEELFRESLCTDKWSGTGDKKLKEWLDRYFVPTGPDAPGEATQVGVPFPGKVKSITPSYDGMEWGGLLGEVKPVKSRTVPKEWQYFHFLTQLLFDSKIVGCLPSGDVSYDHIVTFNASNPLTSHPFNFCAVSKDLNSLKGGKSFAEWNPSGLHKSRYELQCLNDLSHSAGVHTISTPNFLGSANTTGLAAMIALRAEVMKSAIVELFPRWIQDGD